MTARRSPGLRSSRESSVFDLPRTTSDQCCIGIGDPSVVLSDTGARLALSRGLEAAGHDVGGFETWDEALNASAPPDIAAVAFRSEYAATAGGIGWRRGFTRLRRHHPHLTGIVVADSARQRLRQNLIGAVLDDSSWHVGSRRLAVVPSDPGRSRPPALRACSLTEAGRHTSSATPGKAKHCSIACTLGCWLATGLR